MFLTVDEIAEKLKISRQTVINFIIKKELPAVKIGRQWRIDKDDFYEWLKERKKV